MLPPSKVKSQLVKKLFNLGLHLNNKFDVLFTNDTKFTRFGNVAVVRDPIRLAIQFLNFVRIFQRLLLNKEQISIINTNPKYSGYVEMFEGTNVICFEEPWVPGSLTNPLLGYKKTTLVVLVSTRMEDQKIILTEIQSAAVPVINLTQHNIERVLYDPKAFPNRNHIYFYLQLMQYLLLIDRKKNVLNPVSTIFEQGLFEQNEQIRNLFLTLRTTDQKSGFFNLPTWTEKQFDPNIQTNEKKKIISSKKINN